MSEPMKCSADQLDERGVGRCPCSLVTATGGACGVFGPLPTFAEAFPYLTTPPADLAAASETKGA